MPAETALSEFHPAVAAWFESRFAAPTATQRAAWSAIRAGRHSLIAAPTGSGKTLAAFLAAIDGLVREGIDFALAEQTSVVYVSPLKALSNDIALNLEEPLAGIRSELERRGHIHIDLRAGVRTGDTPAGERQRMLKSPPHILVTTPESLYLLLGSASGRRMLASTRTVILDEIHAVVGDKRGSHLALSLERLELLCQRRLQRIGLSATQDPIEEVARFLVGAAQVDAAGQPDCVIVDSGHVRERDLALELPVPVEAVMSGEAWSAVHDRLAQLVQGHRTTLVFVNTRRMVERVSRHLAERLGKERVGAHHGSLAKELRLEAEQRLKRGQLQVLVATASLELGIDIGEVDLVCQLGSPHAIAAFLQRVGRSGHAIDAVPKGRLFPLSRDDLVECVALLDCVARGELDRLSIPPAPLDVLSQQIVAAVACDAWDESALFDVLRRAWPYRRLERRDFDAVMAMLAAGFNARRGPRSGYVHRDAVHGRVSAQRQARLVALTSGGTIPETADYSVVLEPQAITVGSVHEDFAIESLAGDIFQLGNTSYRVLRVERGRLRVEDAHGAPPSMPFWIAEAPGRSDALSAGVSRLRERIEADLEHGVEAAAARLVADLGLDPRAARELVEYLARAHAALGRLPSHRHIVLERFFDESGGTQLVIHSPFGSRINKAWGLALRKRFCRSFNFELQAAATEDAIILSLSTSHSFELIEVSRYLHSASACDVLVQALLDAPLFGVRWRWAATTALALPRFRGGQKIAPQLQRMKAEDLLASVFPDQVACLENIVGDRQIPDHPLVSQTLWDCLHEAMDSDGWLAVLRGLEAGTITVSACDLPQPSALAAEILSARPYAFLDDAPLEERRTQAVQMRRWSGPENQSDLAALDPGAIETVRTDAWPDPRDAEEMHACLLAMGALTEADVEARPAWCAWLERLARDARACRLWREGQAPLWVAAESLPMLEAACPGARAQPAIEAPAALRQVEWSAESARVEWLRGRLGALGPVSAHALSTSLGLERAAVDMALLALEREGSILRGRFTASGEEEWCERHLLARIHRLTLQGLRREIEPVEVRDFMRFLFHWQRLSADTRARGADALAAVLGQLEGFCTAAASWESELLPARLHDYQCDWLDQLCRSGRIRWARLATAAVATRERATSPLPSTPIALLPRRTFSLWTELAGSPIEQASSRAMAVLEHLRSHGASFFDELAEGTGLLNVELETALGELVSRGAIHADSFAGLRALLMPAGRRKARPGRHGRHAQWLGIAEAGRWAVVHAQAADAKADAATDTVEHVARCLLRRYGVIAWRLLAREADWLPPWRELLRVYRQLEARGEIRGGRFIAGLSGEQFALPEAIPLLRAARQRPRTDELVVISACDPLNFTGILDGCTRVPAQPGSRILHADGIAVAARIAGKLQRLDGQTEPLPEAWRSALSARPGTTPSTHPPAAATAIHNHATAP